MDQFRKWKQPGPVFYSYDRARYTTPLAYESRAFARPESRNENGTWAIECYGWMKLSDTQFNTIRNVADTLCLSRWIIVKEYLSMPTDYSHICTMFMNFDIPEAARIWPGDDIRVENYRGSKSVDISSTITFPSPGWSEFEFGFFHKETIFGVFNWFKNCQNCLCQQHQDLFPRPFPSCFGSAVPERESGGATGALTFARHVLHRVLTAIGRWLICLH